jgi:hypothetical protein
MVDKGQVTAVLVRTRDKYRLSKSNSTGAGSPASPALRRRYGLLDWSKGGPLPGVLVYSGACMWTWGAPTFAGWHHAGAGMGPPWEREGDRRCISRVMFTSPRSTSRRT